MLSELEALQSLKDKTAANLAQGKSVDELVGTYVAIGSTEPAATLFITTIKKIGEGRAPWAGWETWAGAFARRASAEFSRRLLILSSRWLAGGGVATALLVLWNPRGVDSQVRQVLQLFVFALGSIVIGGLLGVIPGGSSWLQTRGTPCASTSPHAAHRTTRHAGKRAHDRPRPARGRLARCAEPRQTSSTPIEFPSRFVATTRPWKREGKVGEQV